jgi:hypothetical protein
MLDYDLDYSTISTGFENSKKELNGTVSPEAWCWNAHWETSY